jgi:hypothetical protein
MRRGDAWGAVMHITRSYAHHPIHCDGGNVRPRKNPVNRWDKFTTHLATCCDLRENMARSNKEILNRKASSHGHRS